VPAQRLLPGKVEVEDGRAPAVPRGRSVSMAP
jgi:hypothetical protein